MHLTKALLFASAVVALPAAVLAQPRNFGASPYVVPGSVRTAPALVKNMTAWSDWCDSERPLAEAIKRLAKRS